MISKLAMGEIAALKAEGLDPAPEDIIRLNALALAYERRIARHPYKATNYLPRCVVISSSLYIREPAIGHEMWLSAISRNESLLDRDTQLSLMAFALSRDVDELPDPNRIASVVSAVKKFAREVRACSRQQIYAAVDYALHGFDECAGESGLKKSREEDRGARMGLFPIDFCLAMGVLNEGRAALIGISMADMKSMSRRELSEVISNAAAWHKFPAAKDPGVEERGEFYAALDEITERLKNERKR